MNTLVERLTIHARRISDRPAFIFLDSRGRSMSQVTYEELDHRARAIGGFLQKVCKAGDRVLILHPPGFEYLSSFLGCLYGGVFATPLYPPASKRHEERLSAVAQDCDASLILPTLSFWKGLVSQ